MLPNLAVLEKKCKDLGLKVEIQGKKAGKADYVRALRQHFLPPAGLPYEEVDPMLCFAEWNLKPTEQEKIWKSPNWVAQQKLNGCRLVLHFVKGKGVFAHSRTVSVKTFRYEELTSKLPITDYVPYFDATVDCEVLVDKPVDTRAYTAKGAETKTSLHSTVSILHLSDEASQAIQRDQDAPLHFFVFDIMRWEGQDLRKRTLRQRLVVLQEFNDRIKQADCGHLFHFPEVRAQNKRGFYEEIVKNGGEGVILKNLEGQYEDSSSRNRMGWVKVKRRMEFDAFVSGFQKGNEGTGFENLVGALEFSVMTDRGPHVLGYASNLTLEFRKSISVFAGGNVTLATEIYGKVAEISGQDVSARERRLSHCTLDRWRDQTGDTKRKEDCFVNWEDLVAASEWVGS